MYDVIWIWLLSLPIFAMVLKSWYPWCCCDFEDPPPCQYCTADADTVSLSIAGASDDACNLCNEGVNSTYILRRSLTGACGWGKILYGGACNATPSLDVYTFKMALSVNPLYPSPNIGWSLTLELTGYLYSLGGIYMDVAVYRWNSGGTSDIDCTASRSLTNFSYTPDPTRSPCANFGALTVSIN